MPIASGLLTTLKVREALAALVCHQGLFGIGGRIGFQGPQVAAQTIPSPKDSPIGIAVIIFAQNFGPAIFISAAQMIFTQRLQSSFGTLFPDLDASELEQLGLSDLRKYIPASKMADTLRVYDESLTTFFLAVGLAIASFVGALGMEWNGGVSSRRARRIYLQLRVDEVLDIPTR